MKKHKIASAVYKPMLTKKEIAMAKKITKEFMKNEKCLRREYAKNVSPYYCYDTRGTKNCKAYKEQK